MESRDANNGNDLTKNISVKAKIEMLKIEENPFLSNMSLDLIEESPLNIKSESKRNQAADWPKSD